MKRITIILIVLLALSVISIAGLGKTYNEVMNYFTNYFVMEYAELDNNQPRWMGQSNAAILELIGERQNIDKVSLTVGFDGNDTYTYDNAALIIRLTKNLFSYSYQEKAQDFIINSIREMRTYGNDKVKDYFGNKSVEIIGFTMQGFNFHCITIE